MQATPLSFPVLQFLFSLPQSSQQCDRCLGQEPVQEESVLTLQSWLP